MAKIKNTTCTVEECENFTHTRGWCSKHYSRWQRHGSPHYVPVRDTSTEEARFWSHVDRGGDCWVWQSTKVRHGYGSFSLNTGKRISAHRYAWQLAEGPIPEDMYIDHICFTPACVRPDHLRLATPKQNMEYRNGVSKNNTSGVRGVTWSRKVDRWQAQVGHLGRCLFLGYYDTVEEASEVVRAKRAELFSFPEPTQ